MIGIIGIILGIILVFPLRTAAPAPGCENCGCCMDSICGRGYAIGRYIDEYCTHGCIQGYSGNKCYNKCPASCLTCNQTEFRLCESCTDGKYLGPTYSTYTQNNHPRFNRDCLNCSSKCKKCTSLKNCQECTFPYFNDDITTNCSLTCPRNCMCESVGICSSCKQGYYNTTNQCRDACPNTCLNCTDERYCQSCKPSYSGDMCCVKDGYCKKCSSSTVCEEYTFGYYGEICNKPCPGTCQMMSQETQCEKDSGACLSCDVSLYGDYCAMNCSERCLYHKCHKDNGHCTDGCIVGFEGPTCADKKCSCNEAEMVNAIRKTIGIASAVFVTILLIMIISAIIAVRRWKEEYQRMIQALENRVSYVNTQLPSVSIIKGDAQSLGKEQYEYETLDDRNVTHGDEYEQI